MQYNILKIIITAMENLTTNKPIYCIKDDYEISSQTHSQQAFHMLNAYT